MMRVITSVPQIPLAPRLPIPIPGIPNHKGFSGLFAEAFGCDFERKNRVDHGLADHALGAQVGGGSGHLPVPVLN
jgi:hypothetical protein